MFVIQVECKWYRFWWNDLHVAAVAYFFFVFLFLFSLFLIKTKTKATVDFCVYLHKLIGPFMFINFNWYDQTLYVVPKNDWKSASQINETAKWMKWKRTAKRQKIKNRITNSTLKSMFEIKLKKRRRRRQRRRRNGINSLLNTLPSYYLVFFFSHRLTWFSSYFTRKAFGMHGL